MSSIAVGRQVFEFLPPRAQSNLRLTCRAAVQGFDDAAACPGAVPYSADPFRQSGPQACAWRSTPADPFAPAVAHTTLVVDIGAVGRCDGQVGADIHIGPGLLRRCRALRVKITNAGALVSVGDDFLRQSSIRGVTLDCPRLAAIGRDCCSGCQDLLAANFGTLPCLQTVGSYWLASCPSLRTAMFDAPRLERVGDLWLCAAASLPRVAFILPSLHTVGSSWLASSNALHHAIFALPALRRVGPRWLDGCSGLVAVDVTLPLLYDVGDRWLGHADRLRRVDIDAPLLAAVGAQWLTRCPVLSTVIIAAPQLQRIGDGALSGCPSLERLDLSSVASVRVLGAEVLGGSQVLRARLPLIPPFAPLAEALGTAGCQVELVAPPRPPPQRPPSRTLNPADLLTVGSPFARMVRLSDPAQIPPPDGLLTVYGALGKPNFSQQDASYILADPEAVSAVQIALPTDTAKTSGTSPTGTAAMTPTAATKDDHGDAQRRRVFVSPMRLVLEVALAEHFGQVAASGRAGGEAESLHAAAVAGRTLMGSDQRGVMTALDSSPDWVQRHRHAPNPDQGRPPRRRRRQPSVAETADEQQTPTGLRPDSAARRVLNWYRGLAYQDALRRRAHAEGARGQALVEHEAAASIQAVWAAHRQRRAFRHAHEALLEEYFSTEMRDIDAAATIQFWLRDLRASWAQRRAAKGARHEQLQLQRLPRAAEVRQEAHWAAACLQQWVRRKARARAEIHALRVQRQSRPLGVFEGRREQVTAACVIQRAWRQHTARCCVCAHRLCRLEEERTLRGNEAAITLQRHCRLVVAKARRRRAEAAAIQQTHAAHVLESAVLIQSAVRGHMQASLYRRQKHWRDSAVRTIQCFARRCGARDAYRRLVEGRAEEDDYARVVEVVTSVQAIVRGFLVRQPLLRQRRRQRLAMVCQPAGRGYLSREALRRHRAALSIMHCLRYVADRRRYLDYKADRALFARAQQREHAARRIQRSWKASTLRQEMSFRVAERRVEERAARVIQKRARCLVARSHLHLLRHRREQTVGAVRLHQAAILIQSTFRGFSQFRRYCRLQQIIADCAGLIQRCGAGFVARRLLSQGWAEARAQRSAFVIQRAFADLLRRRAEKARLQKRRAQLADIRRRDRAVVRIQATVRRCFVQRKYLRQQHQRTVGLEALQAAVAALLSARMANALAVRRRQARAAFAVQRLWLRNRRRLLQLREIRSMEDRASAMTMRGVLRAEAAERAVLYDAWHECYSSACTTRKEEEERLIQHMAQREADWLRRCPPAVQHAAATNIQRVFRGHHQRRAVCELRRQTVVPLQREGRKDLASGIRRVTDVVRGLREQRKEAPPPATMPTQDDGPRQAPSTDVLPDGLEGWLLWLRQHPAHDHRATERLLYQECGARRRLAAMAEVGAAQLFGHFARLAALHGVLLPHCPSSPTTAALATPPSHPGAVVLPPVLLRRPPTRDDVIVPALATDHTPPTDSPRAAAMAAFERAVAGDCTEIDISGMGLREEAVRTVLERAATCENLCRLLIGGNDVRDAICSDVAEVLQRCPRLQVLSLANTNISDVGASHIAVGASHCPSLCAVDLLNTGVTAAYRSHIGHILRHRAQLRAAKDGREERSAAQARQRGPQSCLPSKRTTAPEEVLAAAEEGRSRVRAVLEAAALHQRLSAGHVADPSGPRQVL